MGVPGIAREKQGLLEGRLWQRFTSKEWRERKVEESLNIYLIEPVFPGENIAKPSFRLYAEDGTAYFMQVEEGTRFLAIIGRDCYRKLKGGRIV